MLIDLYQAEYVHEEYERRIKAALLAHAALKARAERTEATAHSRGQFFRWVAKLATTSWHGGLRLIRRWSGRHDAMLSVPIKRQL